MVLDNTQNKGLVGRASCSPLEAFLTEDISARGTQPPVRSAALLLAYRRGCAGPWALRGERWCGWRGVCFVCRVPQS